jgi:hypothetical protein
MEISGFGSWAVLGWPYAEFAMDWVVHELVWP